MTDSEGKTALIDRKAKDGVTSFVNEGILPREVGLTEALFGMNLTPYHAKLFAHELTKRCPSDSIEKLASALVDAQVDLNPHQIEAALFAFRSPLSKGALLADEVGLGKTIEAGLVLSQKWAELGEHCHTHIIPRLKKVIDGEDKGGIMEAVGWKGGGGFRYYHLAPSLLEKDKWGNWVINKAYNPAMLAQAVCKLEGFIYAPSDTVYWQQGHSTERDFIYIITQNLSHDQLQALSDEVGEGRSLLVMCPAFRGKPDKYPNLTIKKIPKTVLSRCEWGHDDYSLRI